MRVKVTALVNRRIWLVDWEALEPYWAKSWQYDAARKQKLSDAYLANWFSIKGGVRIFHVAHLNYVPAESFLMFSNGTHRTRVLARYLRYVPVSADASCYRSRKLAPHFKRRLSREETIDLPDLQILSHAALSARST